MNLYCKETGLNNQETILFIHSENMAGWMWDGQVKALNDYHCIIPDLPEHGRSKDIGPFNIKDAADMLIDLIEDKAHNGKAHLVGISMGAQIILEILNTAPEVAGHVLISGTLINSTPPDETFIKLLNYIIGKYIPVKNDNLSIGSYIRSYHMPRSFIRKYRESTRIIPLDTAEKIVRENILFEMPSNLANVDVPVLVMAGEKDYNIIKESAQELVNVLPNSVAYLAPGVGHMWNMESSQLFNQVLRCWITEKSLPDNLKAILILNHTI